MRASQSPFPLNLQSGNFTAYIYEVQRDHAQPRGGRQRSARGRQTCRRRVCGIASASSAAAACRGGHPPPFRVARGTALTEVLHKLSLPDDQSRCHACSITARFLSNHGAIHTQSRRNISTFADIQQLPATVRCDASRGLWGSQGRLLCLQFGRVARDTGVGCGQAVPLLPKRHIAFLETCATVGMSGKRRGRKCGECEKNRNLGKFAAAMKVVDFASACI